MLILAYIAALTSIIFIPTVGAIKFKYVKEELLWFYLFGIINAAVELYAAITGLYDVNNIEVVNFFSIFQCLFLSLILFKWIHHRTLITALKIILGVIVLFALTRIIIYPFNQVDEVAVATENIFLIISSGTAMIYLTNQTDLLLFRNPKFWICSGVFIYQVVTTLVLTTMNLFEDRLILMRYCFVINSILIIIANVLYSIAFLCLPIKTN